MNALSQHLVTADLNVNNVPDQSRIAPVITIRVTLVIKFYIRALKYNYTLAIACCVTVDEHENTINYYEPSGGSNTHHKRSSRFLIVLKLNCS